MPTINVDMMKQLLQEFSEKESLTSEEIKVIEEQISELEGRITLCHNKLRSLNEDKERLAVMFSHYVGGNVLPSTRPALKMEVGGDLSTGSDSGNKVEQEVSESGKETSENLQRDIDKARIGQAIKAGAESKSVELAHQIGSALLDSDASEPNKELKDVDESAENRADSKEKTEETPGGEDAIKSINDALKGLFRK